MCKTRIKVLRYSGFEENTAIENEVNNFIKNSKNKVAKVNSINGFSSATDKFGTTDLLIAISYELGD